MTALAESIFKPTEPAEPHAVRAASVIANLSYLEPGAEHPVSYAYEPPPGTPWESCGYVERAMVIRDARYLSDRPSIEREGFELWDAPTKVRDFTNEEEVKRVYYAEASELAMAVTGASRAYVFDHLVRKRENDRGKLNFGRASKRGQAGANGRIHNDYSEASGRRRLELVLTDPAAREGVPRYSIVNVWRSISGPVLDTPLAVLDALSVGVKDLVVSEVRYPRRTGEIYLVKHSGSHRWAYYSAMDRHEALVFKQYDSQVSGVSRFTPHAAFEHPNAPAGAPLRESIELRCLVTYE